MSKVVIKDKTILNAYIDILKGSLKSAEKDLEEFEKDPSKFYTESMKAVVERCSNITEGEFEEMVNDEGLRVGTVMKRKKGCLFWRKEVLEWISPLGRSIVARYIMESLMEGYIKYYRYNGSSAYLARLLRNVGDTINGQIRSSLVGLKNHHANKIKDIETLIHSSVDSVVMDEVEYQHILKTVGEDK